MMDLSSRLILELRRRALRRGVWFKVLDRAERAILDLVPKCVDKPKSPRLIDAIAKIIVKLKAALASPIIRLRSQIGWPLAQKISRIAQKWGNKRAREWAEDKGFIQYLTIIKINDISIFR